MTPFQILANCAATSARVGEIVTPHGTVPTPAFIPVGSQASVKTLTPQEVAESGAWIVLANAYHLYLQPGVEVIQRMGGLHHFMGWSGPILTDSGGYQIFSLASLRRVREEGVVFRSHRDGSEHFLTPEAVIEIEEGLGADIIMVLDEPPTYGTSRAQATEATERTHRWAMRSQAYHRSPGQALFGIAQGGTFADLREQSARFLASLNFDGYAVGGLCLGEPKEVMWDMVEATASALPVDKVRYFMGVGSPEDLVEGVARGMDLFDSALPTRVARNGALFMPQGRYNIRNVRFRESDGPVDPNCDCYTCRQFSLGYLHHLFKAEELLGLRLATIHNLRFIMRLMLALRQAILAGDFPAFREEFHRQYQPSNEGERLEQKQRWLRAREKLTGYTE